MDRCYEIFRNKELKKDDLKETIFREFLSEFLESYSVDFDFRHYKTYESKVRNLKYDFIYNSQYLGDFFEMLYKYGYNMIEEIRDAVGYLNWAANSEYEKIISTLLNSPAIDDIIVTKDTIKICSEEYGDFDFKPVHEYLKGNDEISRYIENEEMLQRCHHHTQFLSDQFKDMYAITSYLDSYFESGYYHSYTYDSDSNIIIDLCQCAMDKETYDRLYAPKCISSVLNSDLKRQIEIVDETVKFRKIKVGPLKVALYKEYLHSIGYTGPLEKGPSLKKTAY